MLHLYAMENNGRNIKKKMLFFFFKITSNEQRILMGENS